MTGTRKCVSIKERIKFINMKTEYQKITYKRFLAPSKEMGLQICFEQKDFKSRNRYFLDEGNR